MAQIPTIPGSARIQDVEIGAKRNVAPRERALGAFRETVGKATGAIQETLGAVAEYEEKKRKAEEGYVINMTSLGLQKLHTAFLHSTGPMPDDQIVKNWTDQAAAFKQTQMETYGPKLSPRAKQFLSLQLDAGIGEATGKFQVLADMKGSERRRSAAVANSHEFIKSGDEKLLPKATSALQIAVKNGDMTQDQANAYEDQFPGVLQANQIRNGIGNNAVATLHKIDDNGYPDVPETTLLSLRTRAEGQVNKNKVAKYNDIRKQQADGKIYTKKDLSDMADREEIEGSSIDTILKAQKGDIDPADIETNTAKVFNSVTHINPNLDDNGRLSAVAKIHGSKEYNSLPEAVKKDFDEALKKPAKAAAEEAKEQNVSVKLALQKAGVRRTMGAFLPALPAGTPMPSGHWYEPDFLFGSKTAKPMSRREFMMKQDPTLAAHWRTSVPDDVFDQEERNFAAYQKGIMQYADEAKRQKKNVDPAQLEEYGQALTKQLTGETARAPTKAEYDALPEGATYYGTDGKPYIK